MNVRQTRIDRLAATLGLLVAMLASSPGYAQGDDVVVFGADWCAACHSARDKLLELGVAARYVRVDDEGLGEYESYRRRHGVREEGIPLIDVDGVAVRGFDVAAIERAVITRRVGSIMAALANPRDADLYVRKRCAGSCAELVAALESRGATVRVHDLSRPDEIHALRALSGSSTRRIPSSGTVELRGSEGTSTQSSASFALRALRGV